MRKVISILAISAFTAGLVVVAAPANASRSCVAQFNNAGGGGPASPPGLRGEPVKGEVVSGAAHLDRSTCSY